MVIQAIDQIYSHEGLAEVPIDVIRLFIWNRQFTNSAVCLLQFVESLESKVNIVLGKTFPHARALKKFKLHNS